MKNTAQSRFFIIKYQGQSHQSTHNAKINIIDHASTHNNKENILLDNYYCCVATIITSLRSYYHYCAYTIQVVKQTTRNIWVQQTSLVDNFEHAVVQSMTKPHGNKYFSTSLWSQIICHAIWFQNSRTHNFNYESNTSTTKHSTHH